MALSEKTERAPVLGCDIGNGFSYASVARGAEAQPLSLMPPRFGAEGMPSEALVLPPHGDTIQVWPVDRMALKRAPKPPVVGTIKRKLPEKALKLKNIDRSVEPGEVYAAIARDLVKLANDTAAEAGLPACRDLVFAYPAAFEEDPKLLHLLDEMESRINSVDLDGKRLRVVRRIAEPAAAGIAYLHFRRHLAPEGRLTVLVYDLGHGTFDAAVVTVQGRGERYESSLGLSRGKADIGGTDFDELIRDEFAALLKDRGHEPRGDKAEETLLRLAREAKHALSDRALDRYEVSYPGAAADIPLVLSRARFEELVESDVNVTIEIVLDLLAKAERQNVAVDRIVLVGGASQMPIVEDKLRRATEDRYPIELFMPSWAISFGAALYGMGVPESALDREAAGGKEPLPPLEGNSVLVQTTGAAYGVMLPGVGAGPGTLKQWEFRPMIPAGAELPARSAAPLRLETKSGEMTLRVCRQSEDAPPREIKISTFHDLPPNRACKLHLIIGEGHKIYLRLLDAEGKEHVRGPADRANNA